MGLRAAVVGIEIDSKQKYLFESDKLREMVGASRLMAQLPQKAAELIWQAGAVEQVFVFQPLSGEVRMWSDADEADRTTLLGVTWGVKAWLDSVGIDHTTAYFECDARHFTALTSCHITVEKRRKDDEPKEPSLSWVNARLTRRLAGLKIRSKSDARPTNSFFAPCQIYGADVANHWNPQQDPKEPRRQLVSLRSNAKLVARNTNLDEFYEKHLHEPVKERLEKLGLTVGRPIKFSDLAEDLDSSADRDDSFISFLCADADDMGRLLPLINWNTDGIPWENNRDFITDLDDCVQAAFHDALPKVTVPDADQLTDAEREKVREKWRKHLEGGKAIRLPALPQLLGGDDLWTVASKEVALELAALFARRFGVLTSTATSSDVEPGATVRRVVRAVANTATGSDATPTLTLTMSVGVAFAKCGHPAYAMAEAAEDLLKSAKDRRKGQTFRGALPQPEGCIDWHIIESSLVESIGAARAGGWIYHDPSAKPTDLPGTMLLTTRPWTLSETSAFMVAAGAWRKGIGRRKREQVEDILRRGSVLSQLAWKAWLQKLQRNEPTDLKGIVDLVPTAMKTGVVNAGPWREIPKQAAWSSGRWFETPFLDLLALSDVLVATTPEADGPDQEDANADTEN